MVKEHGQPNRVLIKSNDYHALKDLVDTKLKEHRGWVENGTDTYIAPTQSAQIIATMRV